MEYPEVRWKGVIVLMVKTKASLIMAHTKKNPKKLLSKLLSLPKNEEANSTDYKL
jgi:hypothetical protein